MPVKSQQGSITFTACCDRCKDIFTVWGVVKKGKVYIEPQSHIRTKGNKLLGPANLVPLKGKFYHHCGCELRFYPDYRYKSIFKS